MNGPSETGILRTGVPAEGAAEGVEGRSIFAKEVADRVLFVDGGQILEDGTPAQVFDAPSSDRTKLFLSKIL